MADIVKFIGGILVKKARSKIAERLKDSDITDEQCRRLIVRELDDIKTKLDGLARRDVLSSLCFLQEGIDGIYRMLPTEQTTLVEASSVDTLSVPPLKKTIALVNATTSLKIHGSTERFKSHIKSFRLAREKATEAFCNEALPLEDRIQAAQVRMMARILEKLEDPNASACDCLQYLKQLYDIKAIQEIYSVLVEGGVKSWFNRSKRINIASTIHSINQLLCDFMGKFTNLPPDDLPDWPTICSPNRSMYLPVFGGSRSFKKLDEFEVTLLVSQNQSTSQRAKTTPPKTKREIVSKIGERNTITICKPSGESRTFCKELASECWFEATNTRREENQLFIIEGFRQYDDQPWKYTLHIFDENGNKKRESRLPFHQTASLWPYMHVAVNKNWKVAYSSETYVWN